MIIDSLENIASYQTLNQRLVRALNYLRETDFSGRSVGEYPLEERDIFAIVSDYSLKTRAQGKLEAHRQYVDIQYLVRGTEMIGYAPLAGQEILVDYEHEKDCVFYRGDSSLITLVAGMFAVFFPQDLHMPGIGDPAQQVRKVVVKVRL